MTAAHARQGRRRLERSRKGSRSRGSRVPEHQIVPMHHLGAPLDAEDEQAVARRTCRGSSRRPRRRRRRGRARSPSPSGPRTITASPRANAPSTLITPTGSRLLPRRSAATAPASIVSVPFGSSEPAIHFLRAVTGLAGVRNQVQRPSSRDRAQRMRRCGPTRSPCGCRRSSRSCRPRSWCACRRARAPSRTRPPSPRSRA